MRSFRSFDMIFLHRSPVDGRKQINGLTAIIQGSMDQNPFGTGIFIFISKSRDVLRMIYWDKSGFAMWTKRLEKEKFRWPSKMEVNILQLSTQQLSWLLDGLDITKIMPHQELNFSSVG